MSETFLGQVVEPKKLKSVISQSMEDCRDWFKEFKTPEGLYDLDGIYMRLRGSQHGLGAGDAYDYIQKMFHPKYGRLKTINEISVD